MAYSTKFGNYVKFLRGTPTQWAALSTADKDTDTLYFISDAEGTTGKLYLGPKLISGGDTTTATTVKDLQDVLLSEDITANSLLVYDKEKDKWVNKATSEVLASVVKVMKGATANADGEAGLVPVPTQGQQDLFLRGDGTWADPTIELSATVATLVGEDAGKSAREIAKSEVQKIVGSAPEALDTLEEISTWIENHESTVNLLDLNNKVTNLNNIVINGVKGEGEEITTPSLISQVGDLKTALTRLNTTVYGTESDPSQGLVTITSNLNASIASLNTTVTKHTSYIADIQSDIADIKGSLKWQDIIIES